MLRRPPRRDGDNESVEDVDDDEFEAILGGSAGGAVTPSSITAVLPVSVAERVCVCVSPQTPARATPSSWTRRTRTWTLQGKTTDANTGLRTCITT